MKRKIFKFTVLACASLVMIAGLSACRTTKERPVRFAIASDFHAPDIPDGVHRVATFIKAANDEKVDFIIELGDFCRLDSASQVYRDLWNSFPSDKYHVIGNHDMDRYTFEEYTQGMNMPARYYSFDQGDFHFIVLDGNNLFDGKKYTHYARANYYVDAKKRAHIDPEQMDWLKKDLAATNKRCILFSHQSIEQALNNGAEVRKILEAENQRAGFKKVVMAFGGHNHSNYSKEINGITYVQINSASYVWIGEPTQTEKRYSKEINDRFGGILKYSMTYTEPLYAIVTLNSKGATLKGTDAEFVPPTPKDLNMNDSVGVFPLVSNIKDLKVKF